jgi:hypothetical protein
MWRASFHIGATTEIRRIVSEPGVAPGAGAGASCALTRGPA